MLRQLLSSIHVKHLELVWLLTVEDIKLILVGMYLGSKTESSGLTGPGNQRDPPVQRTIFCIDSLQGMLF
jgi:hypothetical protein